MNVYPLELTNQFRGINFADLLNEYFHWKFFSNHPGSFKLYLFKASLAMNSTIVLEIFISPSSLIFRAAVKQRIRVNYAIFLKVTY